MYCCLVLLHKYKYHAHHAHHAHIMHIKHQSDFCLDPPLHRLYLPSVSTGSPFAAGWTVSERPTIGSRSVPNRGLRQSRQAL